MTGRPGQVNRMVREPRDHINSCDHPYHVCAYPSNHMRSVGSRLGIDPDIFFYKYKWVRPIENPEHIPIEQIYLLSLSFMP
jgi:hypothetical protein